MGNVSTTSADCTKKEQSIFEKVFENDYCENSRIKILKYILGDNKKSNNFADMSELGRYPMYFNVIFSNFCDVFTLPNQCEKKIDNQHVGKLFSAFQTPRASLHEF